MCCRQNPQQSLAHTAKHVAVLQAPDKGISPEMVMQFLAWNAEAAGRCGVLSPAGAAPANVRSLFHSSTVHRANSGCLLEQVGPLSIFLHLLLPNSIERLVARLPPPILAASQHALSHNMPWSSSLQNSLQCIRLALAAFWSKCSTPRHRHNDLHPWSVCVHTDEQGAIVY